MDIQGLFDSGDPNFTRLPIGSCPGQKRLATFSLTITAVDVGEISVSVNVRPARKGIRSVPKKAAVTRCV